MDSSITFRLPDLGISEERGRTPEPQVSNPQVSEPQLSDEVLLAEVQMGSREAMGILFRRYARHIRAVALRVLKDASEADDLVQDVFLLIHRLCRSFDSSKAPARFWIIQMTYRRAISRRRFLSSRHFYTNVELEEQTTTIADSRLVRSDECEQRLAELDLQTMFATLSEDQQKTLRLHFIEGYTLDEIAKMLGQTKGNVRHHSFRGLERLRKLIFASKLPGTRAV
jgi:RNA polymerase sigma-70 factor (ECF subfamily)